MIGKAFLHTLAASLNELLLGLLQEIFGETVRTPRLGGLSWGDGIATLFILLLVLLVSNAVSSLLRRKIRNAKAESKGKDWQPLLLRLIAGPLYLLVWTYGVYLVATPALMKFARTEASPVVQQVFDGLLDLGLFVVLVWFFFQLTHLLESRLQVWASRTASKLDNLLVPLIGRALRVIVPVVGLILALPIAGLSSDSASVVGKGSSILIIRAVAYLLFQAVGLGEKVVLAKYDITAADNLQARKLYTQVHVLSKTAYFIIAIFSIASILMLFEEVRRFGTSILASAGVVGIIIGFAAQHTIANLFAGFQLAMTQPIRLDDVVIVEGEWGRIEEITLTYVLVHIWDDRRLVVPLSYFIEKPFQNWTRVSANLLGSVFFWVDCSIPISQLRLAVGQIVKTCRDWDQRFWNLQVTDTSERAVQIRVLVTAPDASKAWDLRCELREKLIAFLQEECPQGVPRVRASFTQHAPES